MFISNISTDILTLIVIGILFLLSLKFGRKFIVTLILATYPSLIIFSNLSYIDFSGLASGLVTFLIVIAVFAFIIWPNLHVKNSLSKIHRFIDYLLLSIVYVLFLIGLSNNLIYYLDYIFADSGFVHNLIIKIPYFIIISLPMLIILITNKNINTKL